MSYKKELHIVAGPNGAGKTTFVNYFFPTFGIINTIGGDK